MNGFIANSLWITVFTTHLLLFIIQVISIPSLELRVDYQKVRIPWIHIGKGDWKQSAGVFMP